MVPCARRWSTNDSSDSCSSEGSVTAIQEVQLILKWGGILTHAGRQQSETLGKEFRMVMYPR